MIMNVTEPALSVTFPFTALLCIGLWALTSWLPQPVHGQEMLVWLDSNDCRSWGLRDVVPEDSNLYIVGVGAEVEVSGKRSL